MWKNTLIKIEVFNLNTTASQPGSSVDAVFITEATEQEIFLLVSSD